MPPAKKAKTEGHPIDSSGVLEAAKGGSWAKFNKLLTTCTDLSFEDFNELPPGRNYGVVHQIAFHGNVAAFNALLQRHPRVDVKLSTKDGKSLRDVAVEHKASTQFMDALNTAIGRQDLQTLVSLARDGAWVQFNALVNSSNISIELLNTVPPGRIWGVIHQIAYWGNQAVLDALVAKYPTLNLELETSEDAAQSPLDISQGRGHKAFTDSLRAAVDASKASSSAGAASSSSSSSTAESSSAVPSESAAMKTPVNAKGKLCNICYCTEDKDDSIGVACDNDHFLCQDCFTSYVTSESDTVNNPQNIIKNGGRITCVCKIASGCDSHAFANKLIAMVVPDEVYESYLRARDYVVGKDAVAGALAKVKDTGSMNAVEQEQIRNLYKKANGTYSCYMCKKCKFGPIDHGWCSDLSAHQGEEKGSGSSINNACPKCGWFAKQINQWPAWDGSFLHQNGGAPPASSSSSSSSASSAAHANLSLMGKTIVFTGTLSVKRSIAKQMAIGAGAKVTTAVSGNTDVLVCGVGGGEKEYEADYHGTEVWTEAQFMAACNN
jgi:hypothetical protein